jgi:putative transposase
MHPGGVPEHLSTGCYNFTMASTYINLNVHVVFATRDRAPMVDPAWQPDLHAYIGGAFRGLGGVPLAVNGTSDHIHTLVSIRATHCVSDLVREVKKASSIWSQGHCSVFGWQEGYACLSVGYSELARVRDYIELQEQRHRKQSSSDELRELLTEAGSRSTSGISFRGSGTPPGCGCLAGVKPGSSTTGYFLGPLRGPGPVDPTPRPM